jgi:hypothetical protein
MMTFGHDDEAPNGEPAIDRRVTGDEKHGPGSDVMTPLIGRVSLVAHQGGWDEILLVAGPIVVVVGLLAVVRRRVNTRYVERVDGSDSLESSTDR